MTQTVDIAAAVDYERTLVLAIEVSNESWVLAAQVPGLPHTKAKRTINPDAESLMAAIAGYRARATATGHSVERVITMYEAGWSGFWLARWIMQAWDGGIRYPAFECACRSSDAPRKV
jgi:transposase